MELLGTMLYSLLPDSITGSPYFITGILMCLIIISEILPYVPEKYIKSNSTLQIIIAVIKGLGSRVKKNPPPEITEHPTTDVPRHKAIRNPMGGD